MPGWSAGWARGATALSMVCGALLLAACSGGGGSGDSAVIPDSTAPTNNTNTTSVTLAWGEADGPVAGYSVFVQRDGVGGFDHEQDVSTPQVDLTGTPGQRARVIVAAFDRARRHGPSSPASPTFTCPGPPDASAAAAAASPEPSAPASATAQTDATESEDETADEAPIELAGALVWQDGNALRVTDAALETTLQLARPAGSTIVAASDVDADGLADLLWVGVDESGNSTVGFTPSTSLHDGQTPAVVDLGALGEGERVLGTGDFDADGHADVLVSSADSVRAWLVGPDAAHSVSELGAPGAASFVGVGDFDASGTDDVAWRTSDGAVVVWLMDAGQASASVEVAVGADLDAIGSGDFDGDGAAELTLRNAQGDVFRLQPLAQPAALDATDLAGVQTWRPVGSADLDRDGADELVLASADAVRIAGLPGDELLALDPAASDWQLVALIP